MDGKIGSSPSSPKKSGEYDSTGSSDSSGTMGARSVTTSEATPYMGPSQYASQPVDTSLFTRQASLPALPKLQELKNEWDHRFADFKDDMSYEFSGRRDSILSEFCQSFFEPFVQELIQLSIVREELTTHEVAQYDALLSDVISALSNPSDTAPEAGAIYTKASFSRTGRLDYLRGALEGRENLNKMMVDILKLRPALEKACKYESQNLTTEADSTSSTPEISASVYRPIEAQLLEMERHTRSLMSYPPSADIFWLGSVYNNRLDDIEADIHSPPASLSNAITRCKEQLLALTKTSVYSDSQIEYSGKKNQEASIRGLNPESALKSLSQESLKPMHSLTLSEPLPQVESTSSKASTPAEPHLFQRIPVTVGPFTVASFTVKQANDFQTKIARVDDTTMMGSGPFNTQFQKNMSQYCDNDTVNKVFRLGNPRQHRVYYDIYLSQQGKLVDVAMQPLKHNQVVLREGSSEETRLGASRIQYDDKVAGIAMMAPVPDDIPNILQMAWNENSRIFVDLVSSADREKYSTRGRPKFDWGSIPSSPNKEQFGDFSIEKTSEETHVFKSSIKNSDGQLITPEATIRKFKMVGPEGERIISQIAFPHWIDGKSVTPEVLEEMHSLTDQQEAQYESGAGLVVNCIAGVGRTGTYFATRHLRGKAIRGELDTLQLNSEVLNVLIQGKLSRNNHFVQYANQAILVKDHIEKHLRMVGSDVEKDQPVKKPDSPAPVTVPVRIGPYTPTAVTAEMGTAFTQGLDHMLENYQSMEKAYKDADNAYDNLPSDAGYSDKNLALQKITSTERELSAAKIGLKSAYFQLMFDQTKKLLPEQEASELQFTPYFRNTPPHWIKDVSDSQHHEDPAPYVSNDLPQDIPHRSTVNTPVAHSQIVLGVKAENAEAGHPIKLSANHIYLDGLHAGIAMQAPRPSELGHVIQCARENQAHILVDLTSQNDRTKSRGSDAVLDWSSIQQETSEDFTVSLKSDIKENIEHEGKSYELTVRQFVHKPTSGEGEEQQLTQFSFADWPDGEALPFPVLKKFNQHIEKANTTPVNGKSPIMVNCMAGLGRTGTLMVLRYISEHSTEITPENIGQLTLKATTHARMSRSGDVVQTPFQAMELVNFERSFLMK